MTSLPLPRLHSRHSLLWPWPTFLWLSAPVRMQWGCQELWGGSWAATGSSCRPSAGGAQEGLPSALSCLEQACVHMLTGDPSPHVQKLVDSMIRWPRTANGLPRTNLAMKSGSAMVLTKHSGL